MNKEIKDFYRDMFEQQVEKADTRAVFTEYAWDKNWCDPCAADPLFFEELHSLGASWFNETPPDFVPGRGRRPIVPPMGGARDVFATRTPWRLADIRGQMNLRSEDDVNLRQKIWTG